jgi:hypothetical protein
MPVGIKGHEGELCTAVSMAGAKIRAQPNTVADVTATGSDTKQRQDDEVQEQRTQHVSWRSPLLTGDLSKHHQSDRMAISVPPGVRTIK